MKANILVIYTGGTIGMIKHEKEDTLVPYNLTAILTQIPELQRLDCTLDFHVACAPALDSSNIQPEHWITFAQIIQEKYAFYDGFVVLHGTDTMAYTAAALSFLMEDLSKPIIFTGSQLPMNVLRTDARENFITAVELACNHKHNLPNVAEVCIYFGTQLMRGNRCRKLDTDRFDAFHSPNYPALVSAGVSLDFKQNYHSTTPKNEVTISKALCAEVGWMSIFPGMSAEMLFYQLSAPKTQAFVIQAFGMGNMTNLPEYTQVLQDISKQGKILVVLSQCVAGSVHLGKYETSMPLLKSGAVSGFDMTPEAALTKLMYLLAKYPNQPDIIKLHLGESLRGELSRS